MSSNTEFDQYQKLKGSLVGRYYKGISVNRLAGYFIAEFCFSRQNGIVTRIKTFIRKLFFVPLLKKQTGNQPIFGWSLDRPNYNRLADAYMQSMGLEFNKVCLYGKLLGWKLRFSYDAFFHSLSIFFEKSQLGFFERLWQASSVYAAINFLNYTARQFDCAEPQCYVSFNSSYAYESIVTLYFRKRLVKTFSLQHGVFCRYKNNIPIDIVCYENITAEYQLLWGRYYKDEVNDLMPSDTKLIVYGYPLKSDYSAKCLGLTNTKDALLHLIKNNVLVCLPRIIYERECVNLLKILSDDVFSEFNFTVRYHPDSRKEFLHGLVKSKANFSMSREATLADEIKRSRFLSLISFNSTVLFESILYGVKPILYESGNNEVAIQNISTFKDSTRLFSVLLESKAMDLKPDYYFADVSCSEFNDAIRNSSP